MHLRSEFGDSSLNGWWVMVWTNSKWGKIWPSSQIWPWRSRSIISKNNKDPNQDVLHLWSKVGDPSLNERWVIVRTSSWLIHTHRPTDAGDDNTRRPKLASGKKCFHMMMKIQIVARIELTAITIMLFLIFASIIIFHIFFLWGFKSWVKMFSWNLSQICIFGNSNCA